MKTAPRLFHLPDIAQSDFCLFGFVKGCLEGSSFVDAEEIYEAVRGVLDDIEKVTL
jgi:hypothetical protein